MTKETKVGLLVGLAFVIVIGIYLSDHASNTSQAPQAPLALAGVQVRGGLGDQLGDDTPGIVKIPKAVAPKHPVPTRRDLTPQKKPADKSPGVRLIDPVKTVTPDVPDNGQSDLEKKAAELGEPLVPVDSNNRPVPPAPTPPAPVQPKPPTGVTRSYVAQPGDSLGAIAKKAYGSSCLANRRAILAANPFMNGNQEMIVAGKTYIIPPVAPASSPTATTVEQPSPAPTPTVSTAYTMYIVQHGDTLWSIAETQVGSTAAVSTIMELNKDVLHGSNRVHEAMKLRIPTK